MQGASLFHLAKGLYRRDFFPTRVIVKGLWLQAYFRMIGSERPGHIANAQAASLSFIAGHRATEVEELTAEIYDESIAEHIWPGTRAIAQLHLDVGHQVWLVTAAPVEVAGVIAGRLGMTGALGSVAERERRRLHRPPHRRSAARAGQGGGGSPAGGAARLRSRSLLRLLRLLQRPAAAVTGR